MIQHGLPKVVQPEAHVNSFSKWLMRLNESTKTKEEATSYTKSKDMHLVVLGESAAEIFYNALDGIDLLSSGPHQCLIEYGFVQENHDLGFTRDLHLWVIRNPKNVTTLKDVIPGEPDNNHITYFVGIDLGRTESIKRQLDSWIGNTIKLQTALLEDMSDEEVRTRKGKMEAVYKLPEENHENRSSFKESVDSSLEQNIGAPVIIVGTRTQEFTRKLKKMGRDDQDCLALVMGHLRAECLKLNASVFSSQKDESRSNTNLMKFLKSVALGEMVRVNHCVAQYTNEHGGYAIPAGADSLSLIQISLPEGHKIEAIEALFNEKEDNQNKRNSEFRAKSELNDVHFIKLLKFEIESASEYYKQKSKAQVKKFLSGANIHSSSLTRKPTEGAQDPFTALERKQTVSKQQAELLRAVIGHSQTTRSEPRDLVDKPENKRRSSRDDADDWMNKRFEGAAPKITKREESL